MNRIRQSLQVAPHLRGRLELNFSNRSSCSKNHVSSHAFAIHLLATRCRGSRGLDVPLGLRFLPAEWLFLRQLSNSPPSEKSVAGGDGPHQQRANDSAQ